VNRTDRLYAIREELRRAGNAGRSASQLAATFEVTERTIKRDVSALQQAGFPVWDRVGRTGGYVVDAAATLPPINFTEAEATGLAAALAAHAGEPFEDDARAALAKVLAAMEPGARQRAFALTERVWVEREGTAADARVRRAVESGLRERRRLSVEYRSADGAVTRRTVDPQIIAYTEGSWYMVGYCHLRKALRWFRLERIVAARLTSTPADLLPVADIGTPPEAARSVTPA
jgi:predicted DNA-binding transcriptional regulator YafY